MSTEKAQNEHNVLYPKVEEFQGSEQNVLYPKVEEEIQGTNPPTAPYEEAQEKAIFEEQKGTNPPGEAQDKGVVEEVQGSNPPKASHGKTKDNANGKPKEKAKWGTHIMGAPAAPSAHPQNQEAATWTARDDDNETITPNPYLIKGDTPQQPSKSPMETVLQSFNKWAKKAENLGSNVWTNLRTGQSLPDAAWGKLSLGAKAFSEGGFESLFKQTFAVEQDEKLRKTFACYLSTSAGPVAGTLYISTVKIAFCSDRPLSYTVPSGEQGWAYYRVAVPLVKMKAVNQSVNKEKPAQKYIQVVTLDNHEFWLMGFVNHEKALGSLEESISGIHSCTYDH